MIGDYFDHSYLINLERRPDRKERALSECVKVGLKPEVYKAVDGTVEDISFTNPYRVHPVSWNPNAAGLALTTIGILEEAKRKGYKSILILEDDIEFHPQINQIVDENMKDLPSDWEMMQFGVRHVKPPQRVTFRIFRIREGDCLHCYAMNHTVYDVMLEEIKKMERQIDLITKQSIQPRGKSYCLMPNFAYQRPDWSDIGGKKVNYTFLKS